MNIGESSGSSFSGDLTNNTLSAVNIVKTLSEQEHLEQEQQRRLQRSKNCGIAAYGELTHKVPQEKLQQVYAQEGSFLMDSVRMGAMYTGHTLFQPKTGIWTVQDYIRAFAQNISEQKQNAQKAEAAAPGSQSYQYRSDVDGKLYNTTPDNWQYHVFAGKRENYEAWAEEARTTLEAFGQAALEAGDDETYSLVQQTLKAV